MLEITKPETFGELVEIVKGFGERKEFKKGDIVTCIQTPWGMHRPKAGMRAVIMEPLAQGSIVQDGQHITAAAEIPDYVAATLNDSSPQGYQVFQIHSGFFELAAPGAENEKEN